jgi:predicted nuclease with TOPRIM domain
MAMNIKGIRTRLEELKNGVQEAIEAKEEAIDGANDREDTERADTLETQKTCFEEMLQALEDAESALDNWED